LFGHVSEHYLHKRGTPRPAFLLVAISIMTTCMLAMTLGAPLKALYLLSMLTGFAFGGHWSIVGATTSDFFGLKSFAGMSYVMHQVYVAVTLELHNKQPIKPIVLTNSSIQFAFLTRMLESLLQQLSSKQHRCAVLDISALRDMHVLVTLPLHTCC
jgi:hypothetical protein